MNRRTNILQTPLVHRSVDKTVGHRATDVDKGVDMLRTRTLSSKKKRNDDNPSTAAVAATTTIFEAFTEVALDLTLSFSPQNSPAASTSEVFAPSLTSTPLPPPPRSPSPGGGGASARPRTETTLSRTLSFTTQLRKAKEKSRFSDFLSLQPRSSSSPYRQTVNYTGRGTPVDKNKTRQWGGPFSSSSGRHQRGVVSEDGLLFSTVPELRATSLDLPRLSSSSDWDFLNLTGPSAASGSPRSAKRSVLARSLLEDGEEEEREEEAPPKIEVKLENGVVDWTSVLETALSSAEGGVLSGGGTAVPPPPTILEEGGEERRVGTAAVKEVQSNTTTTTTTIAKTDDDDPRPTEVGGAIPKKQPSSSEVRFDVHIDKALDLGFTPTGDGGTFFDVVASNNLNPTVDHDDDDVDDVSDDGGRNNPSESSLSQYSTPSEGASDDGPAQQQQQALTKMTTTTTAVLSPHGSNGQGKYQGSPVLRMETTPNLYDSVVLSPKVGGGKGLSWWKKGLGKLKRLQVPSRARRSMC